MMYIQEHSTVLYEMKTGNKLNIQQQGTNYIHHGTSAQQNTMHLLKKKEPAPYVLIWNFLSLFVFLLLLFCCIWRCPDKGLNWSHSCRPMSQPQSRWIQAISSNYTTALGNAGSLTHWARPRIEPSTSWYESGSLPLSHDRNSILNGHIARCRTVFHVYPWRQNKDYATELTLEQCKSWGAHPPRSQKSADNSVNPPYPQSLYNLGFSQPLHSTVVFPIEKFHI